jgi:hypothetical protein
MLDITSPTETVKQADGVSATLDLVEHARTECAAMQRAGSEELKHAMSFGDDLLRLREHAPKRGWKKFVESTFLISKSTAYDCEKLAKARAIIESSSGAGQMSIRDALKLLTKPRKPAKGTEGKAKSTRKTEQQPAVTLPALLEKASAEEILAALPKNKRAKIVDRVVGLHRRGGLDSPATKLFRAALSLAQAKEPDLFQIIGALRGILRKHVNPSRLEIVEVVSAAQERAA